MSTAKQPPVIERLVEAASKERDRRMAELLLDAAAELRRVRLAYFDAMQALAIADARVDRPIPAWDLPTEKAA